MANSAFLLSVAQLAKFDNVCTCAGKDTDACLHVISRVDWQKHVKKLLLKQANQRTCVCS